MRIFLCIAVVPLSVFIGLLLNGAISPEAKLNREFIAWMVIFVLTIFVPAHLATQAIVYLLAKNRLSLKRTFTTIVVSCTLATVAIALSKSDSPFALVFSFITTPLLLVAYLAASGSADRKPNNSFTPNPLPGSA